MYVLTLFCHWKQFSVDGVKICFLEIPEKWLVMWIFTLYKQHDWNRLQRLPRRAFIL